MDREELIERACEVVSDVLAANLTDVTLESRLRDDLGAEPVQVVELVGALEDEFEIELPVDAADQIETVGDVVDFVAEAIEEQSEQ